MSLCTTVGAESMTRQETPLLRKGKTMLTATEKDSILENVMSSYEARIQSIGVLFEATGQIIQDFQESLLSTRAEREKINSQLRENLARNASLRKKDFDRMMSVISSHVDQSEQEVRELFKRYLREQAKLVQQLRDGLREFRGALVAGRADKVKKLHALIKEILSKQGESKDAITSRLKQFQQGQRQTSKMLKGLLAKGEKLRIRDFKAMLAEFKKQRQERVTSRKQRRQQVRDMLDKFKVERTETERTRLAHQRRCVLCR